MKLKKIKYTPKIIIILLIFIAILTFLNNIFLLNENGKLYKYLYNTTSLKSKIESFQKTFLEKEDEINYQFDYIIYHLKKNQKSNLLAHLYENPVKKDFTLLIYNNKRLLSWYGDNITNNPNFLHFAQRHKFLKMHNMYYTSRHVKFGTYTLVGLVPIFEAYSVENDYIKNKFSKVFKGYDNFVFSSTRGYQIYNTEGETVFSLVNNKKLKRPLDFIFYIVVVLQLILYGSTLLLVYHLFKKLYNTNNNYLYLLLFPLLALGFKFIVTDNINSSMFYKYSEGVTTVVLLNIIFDCLLIFYCTKIIDFSIFKSKLEIKNKAVQLFTIFALFVESIIVFSYFFNVLEYFIVKKDLVPFQNIYDMTWQSMVIYATVVLNILMFIGMFHQIMRYASERIDLKYIISFQFITALIYIILYHDNKIFVPAIIFLAFVTIQISVLSYKKDLLAFYKIILLVVELSIFFAIFSQFLFLTKYDQEKRQLLKELAVDNDPYTESKLINISNNINRDRVLRDLIAKSPNNFEIPRHLSRKYFNTLKDKYEVMINVCFQDDEIELMEYDSSRTTNCFNFYNRMKAYKSRRVKKSNFLFLDNNNGRASYFGEFYFNVNNYLFGIFINIDSKQSLTGVGYPQLLKGNVSNIEKSLKKYSYAKYYKGVIVEQNGTTKYENYLEYYLKSKITDFKYFTKDGVSHIAYKNGDYVVIISDISSLVISFFIELSYIFILISILLVLVNYKKIRIKRNSNLDLQHKILFSLTGTIIFILLILVTFVINNLINQYKQEEDRESVKNVIHASYFIKQELDKNNLLTGEIDNVLFFLSNVIKSDINIYNANGDLTHTSRPEIRERELIGGKINPVAFYNLIKKKKTTYISKENISNLRYKSTYSTILNNSNRVNYIISIPSFTSSSKLNSQKSRLIGIGINSLLFIALISILIIFLIFRKVLKPLHEISEELNNVDFSNSLSKINYKYDDEIGSLVTAYNKKIEELKVNTKLLTESERQNAWRSVSRQVAHEIKNPLTPMKLNIQFLQSAYNREHPEFGNIFTKTTNSLIEHINTLSAIASSFSSFAKMPNLEFENVNIINILDSSINMFDKDEAVKITRHFKEDETYIVHSDPTQIQRCFTNVLKNAIQAVIEKEVDINVYVMNENDHIVIAIQDNGEGISEEQKDKIFTPNFTTKSSGMGIGLTMVKNIIEKSKGDIWFKSEIKQGTTFFIKLPIIETHNN
jgi:signal transduction histidine kinase